MFEYSRDDYCKDFNTSIATPRSILLNMNRYEHTSKLAWRFTVKPDW